MTQSSTHHRFDYKGIERNYLLGAIPWALSRALPVFLALAFGSGLVETLVNFVNDVKWLADGLTLAARMLPGLGFAILLHYLPIKRNLHYLALGFGLTAMLTVIFANIQTLGGAVAGVVKDFNGGAFKALPMIGIAIIGLFLAVLRYTATQRSGNAAATPSVSSNAKSIPVIIVWKKLEGLKNWVCNFIISFNSGVPSPYIFRS